MKGTNLTYGLKQEERRKVDKVVNLLIDQTMKHPLGAPCYYAVLYYGKSFHGEQLEPKDYRKRWDRNEVRKTQNFISNKIRQCFGEIPLWWFINRHDDYEDAEGTPKKGSFHSDLYIGEIPDDAVENPSEYLLPLFYEEDEIGVPINMRPVDLDCLKLLLLEACIRQAQWVGRHPDSLKLSKVPPQEMEDRVLGYGLKDLTNLDELNSIIDWRNSAFYTPEKETTKK